MSCDLDHIISDDMPLLFKNTLKTNQGGTGPRRLRARHVYLATRFATFLGDSEEIAGAGFIGSMIKLTYPGS
jgi:hypothetical protein